MPMIELPLHATFTLRSFTNGEEVNVERFAEVERMLSVRISLGFSMAALGFEITAQWSDERNGSVTWQGWDGYGTEQTHVFTWSRDDDLN